MIIIMISLSLLSYIIFIINKANYKIKIASLLAKYEVDFLRGKS